MTAYENKNMLKIFQNAPATSKYQIIKKAISSCYLQPFAERKKILYGKNELSFPINDSDAKWRRQNRFHILVVVALEHLIRHLNLSENEISEEHIGWIYGNFKASKWLKTLWVIGHKSFNSTY